MENIDSTQMDDSIPTAGQDGPSIDDLRKLALGSSEFFSDEDKVALLGEEIPVPSEDDSVEEDPEESSLEQEEESDDSDQEELEEEGEEGDDEESTSESDSLSVDDLDLDAKLTVKVDGEEMDVSFGDLIKGYQTDQHLSKKGRELGEARKSLETEYQGKLQNVDAITSAARVVLQSSEDNLAKNYHNIQARIDKARSEGDTFTVNELKDAREQAQNKYWEARRFREGLEAQAIQHRDSMVQQDLNSRIEHFSSSVSEVIPDFTPELGNELIEFAMEEGVPQELIPHLIHPSVAKVFNNYRNLKTNVSKGSEKRKAAPKKKAIPMKKGKPATKKKEDAEKAVKARAFRQDASQEDRRAFLRQHASKTLSNI